MRLYKKKFSHNVLYSYDALCKLLLHAVSTGDVRFEEIMVADQQLDDIQGEKKSSSPRSSVIQNYQL